jgi:hypothetical protein
VIAVLSVAVQLQAIEELLLCRNKHEHEPEPEPEPELEREREREHEHEHEHEQNYNSKLDSSDVVHSDGASILRLSCQPQLPSLPTEVWHYCLRMLRTDHIGPPMVRVVPRRTPNDLAWILKRDQAEQARAAARLRKAALSCSTAGEVGGV